MAWSFSAPQTGFYQVQLFTGSGCACIDKVGRRIYDVDIEGQVLPSLNDLALVAIFGRGIGGVVSSTVEVTDDAIDLVYISGKQRPIVNAIENTLLTKLAVGAAALSATVDCDEVQWSSSLPNSFQVTNRGAKRVARVHVEVTDTLFLDTVFNPLGLAGDTISRPLRVDDSGGTGVVDPATYLPYQGGGGDAGYQGLVLLFDEQTDGGF